MQRAASTGGIGGGGAGSNGTSAAVAGGVNTGGGGGGGGVRIGSSGSSGQTGGSGVVIFSYDITSSNATGTGSFVYTEANNKRIFTFTGLGTIRFNQ